MTVLAASPCFYIKLFNSWTSLYISWLVAFDALCVKLFQNFSLNMVPKKKKKNHEEISAFLLICLWTHYIPSFQIKSSHWHFKLFLSFMFCNHASLHLLCICVNSFLHIIFRWYQRFLSIGKMFVIILNFFGIFYEIFELKNNIFNIKSNFFI